MFLWNKLSNPTMRQLWSYFTQTFMYHFLLTCIKHIHSIMRQIPVNPKIDTQRTNRHVFPHLEFWHNHNSLRHVHRHFKDTHLSFTHCAFTGKEPIHATVVGPKLHISTWHVGNKNACLVGSRRGEDKDPTLPRWTGSKLKIGLFTETLNLKCKPFWLTQRKGTITGKMGQSS